MKRLQICPEGNRRLPTHARAVLERLGRKFCKSLSAQLDSRVKGEGRRGCGDPSHWADPSRSLPYRGAFPFKQTLARLEADLQGGADSPAEAEKDSLTHRLLVYPTVTTGIDTQLFVKPNDLLMAGRGMGRGGTQRTSYVPRAWADK